MHEDRISERAPAEVSARELHAMSGPELHALGAQLGRELLAELPPAPAPRPLAALIFDFAEQLRLIGAADLEAL